MTTTSPDARASEAANKLLLFEIQDRGLLDDVDEDIVEEIRAEFADAFVQAIQDAEERGRQGTNEPTLKRLEVKNGATEMDVSVGAERARQMALSLTQLFVETGGVNFIEMTIHHGDDSYIVTVQKKSGLTPASRISTLESRLRIAVEALEMYREVALHIEEPNGEGTLVSDGYFAAEALRRCRSE